MYNYMTSSLKSRVILELKEFFRRHPTYKNLEIYNRFPNLERVQEGIVVKNTTASKAPLAADNFQGNVYSYACLAKHSNYPGLSIEWVREDDLHLSTRIIRQDVSTQFESVSNTEIFLDDYMLIGGRDLTYAKSFKDVEVYVNNERIMPKTVSGENRVITLQNPPLINSKVEVSYWVKNLAPAGVYQIEITKLDPDRHNFEFMVDCILDKEEVLIEQATGKEQSCVLRDHPIYKGSLLLKENGQIMTKDVDYLLDEQSGIITFQTTSIDKDEPFTVLMNSRIEASYRVQGISTGPFEVAYFDRMNNTAIPGIVLAFGKGVGYGDKQFVIVNSDRINTALEYSGKWEMTISLDVYARDTILIEEIIDLTTSYLNTFKKAELDGEGIALVSVNFSGESEEIFDEATTDLYYKGSVDYNFLTEWIMHQPLFLTVEGFGLISSNLVSEINTVPPDSDGQYEKIK